VDTVERPDTVQKDLEAFIEKRDKQRRQTEGERSAEAAWAESERRYFARLEEEHRSVVSSGWPTTRVRRCVLATPSVASSPTTRPRPRSTGPRGKWRDRGQAGGAASTVQETTRKEDGMTRRNNNFLEQIKRARKAAGWEARGRGAKTIWRSPAGGRWYAHYQALEAMHGANEERLLGEHGFERVPADGPERWMRREEGEELYARSKAFEKVREEE
jgi:hypothetical protein